MIEGRSLELEELCTYCTGNPDDPVSLQRLQNECRRIGTRMISASSYILPKDVRMVYETFRGRGTIAFNRTIVEFATHGRSMEHVIGRSRVTITKSFCAMVILDVSNSMTGWWRNKRFGRDLREELSPQTAAKIATLAFLQGFDRRLDVEVMLFAHRPLGPFERRERVYRDIVASNGMGGSRLDLALENLIKRRWTKREGIRLLVIITDGVIESGLKAPGLPYLSETEIPGGADRDEQMKLDSLIQERTLKYLRQIVRDGVSTLYVPIFVDENLISWRSGMYSARELVREVEALGIEVAPVYRVENMVEVLFGGLNRLARRSGYQTTRKAIRRD
ncbi:MAG: VWA domain-containing protein [Candidatus Syntrophoarchaeum sp. WYZ-LMO15]|nr:MAG: VWA domain-containing protein [Candidatus Syntrophoarchaeum sp. WYZ-LMO15]